MCGQVLVEKLEFIEYVYREMFRERFKWKENGDWNTNLQNILLYGKFFYLRTQTIISCVAT